MISPTHSDVLVVGGGIVGLTLARRLAIEGLSVRLVDRRDCGREASWAGAGIMPPSNPFANDPLFHFQDRAIAAYPTLCATLWEETGIDPEYERCSEIAIYENKQTFGIGRSEAEAGKNRTLEDGSPMYVLHDQAATYALEPIVEMPCLGSLECRATAQIRNPRLLQGLLASAKKHGVDVLEFTPMQDVVVEDSRVTGIVANEQRFSARWVVLAAGAWSSSIEAHLREIMPVTPVRGQMILLKLEERPFLRSLHLGRTYLASRRDGHVLLGGTIEPEAGFSARSTAREITRLMNECLKIAPMLAEAPVVTTWAGLRPGTPDNRPYMGHIPGYEGLIAATGHYRSGLTLAPETAEYITSLITGTPYCELLESCQPGRALPQQVEFVA